MNDTTTLIDSWLSAEAGSWLAIAVPGLIALGVLVAVLVIAAVRRGRDASAAPPPRHRSVRSAGVVFFPR